jgi:tetratricopeptide (TPR) repeat protein
VEPVRNETGRQKVENSTVHGSVTQIGNVAGNATIYGSPPARSAYLEHQVLRIAPPKLFARDDELEELARFCSGADGATYRWWLADAWAGKSALMSWFVLHPPPGVEIVSFFVTARFASQNDRAAFLDVVIEQLADRLGQPAVLAPATREFHLRRMLAEATRAARARGNRLVLVVDGLDEDRGVTIGPDAYSIAALLPADPEPGMSVIVSGRPRPPIPTDVPDGHPLRDPGIVRGLDPSEYAKTVRIDAERELRRLLRGTPIERDLLGFVVAAGGGLSGSDLATLTGTSVQDVEDHLNAVTGRTFATRTEVWRAGSGERIYVLGHEDLQELAAAHLAGPAMETYVGRLIGWAREHADAGWPMGTPEYLLRGYSRLLRKRRDAARLVPLATDRLRHDRMLDISGGDSAAIEEIAAAQEMILEGEPDTTALARLAVHRQYLNDRNMNIPTRLPVVWGALGYGARAEALALSIGDPTRRAAALSYLAACDETAAQMSDVSAETLAALRAALGRIGDDEERVRALGTAARAFSGTGRGELARSFAEQAGALARSMPDADEAVADAAEIAAELGLLNSALDLVSGIAEEDRFRALTRLVEPFAQARRKTPLRALLRLIRSALPGAGWAGTMILLETLLDAGLSRCAAFFSYDLLGALTDWPSFDGARDQVMADLVKVLGSAGEADRARGLLDGIVGVHRRARAEADLAIACAEAGRESDAAQIATLISDPQRRCECLARIIEVVGGRGSTAVDSLVAFETTLGDVDRAYVRTALLARVSGGLGRAGDLSNARRLRALARRELAAVQDPDEAAFAFCSLVRISVFLESEPVLRDLIAEGERHAAAITDRSAAARAFDALANVAITAGAFEDAMRMVDRVTDVAQSAATRTRLVRQMARHGRQDSASRHADAAPSEELGDALRHAICRGLATAGQLEAAADMAGRIRDLSLRTGVMTDLAWIATRAHENGIAVRLAARVETTARLLIDPARRLATITHLAESLATRGDFGRAVELAERLPLLHRDKLFAFLVRSKIISGDLVSAGKLVERIVDRVRRTGAELDVIHAAVLAGRTEVARCVATAGGLVNETAGHFLMFLVAMGEAGCRTEVEAVLTRLGGRFEQPQRLGDPVEQTELWRTFLLASAESPNAGYRATLVAVGGVQVASWSNPVHRADVRTALIAAGSGTSAEVSAELVRATLKDIALVGGADDRSRLLLALGKVLAATGDTTGAGTALRDARVAAGDLDDRAVRDDRLVAIVQVYAGMGELAHGAAAADLIGSALPGDLALGIVATAAARAGHIEYAEAVVGKIADPYRRVRALCDGVRESRLLRGVSPDRLTSVAISGLEDVTGAGRCVELLCMLAREVLLSGDEVRCAELLWRAVDLVRGVDLPSASAELIVGILHSAADLIDDLDELSEALYEAVDEVLMADDEDLDRDELRARLSAAWSGHGRHERALADLRFSEPNDAKDAVLAELVDTGISAGDHRLAHRALAEIHDAELKFSKAVKVLDAAVASGDPDETVERLHEIACEAASRQYDEELWPSAWVGLLRAIGTCGRHRDTIVGAVLTAVRREPDHADSTKIVAELLTALAPWDLPRAVGVLESVDPGEPLLWTALAAGLRPVDTVEVRRALGHAMCVADWPDLIATMARVQPRSVTVIAEEFEALVAAGQG